MVGLVLGWRLQLRPIQFVPAPYCVHDDVRHCKGDDQAQRRGEKRIRFGEIEGRSDLRFVASQPIVEVVCKISYLYNTFPSL